MTRQACVAIIAGVSLLLGGCGGGQQVAVASGLPSVNLRAINLLEPTQSVSVNDGSDGLGTISIGQTTPYAMVNSGSSPVAFVGSSGQIGSFQGQLAYGAYVTVAICRGLQADTTFALADAGAPTGPGSSRIRVADVIPQVPGNANVYIGAGAQPASSALISGNGLTFGTATAYQTEPPGVYTISLASSIDPAVLVFSQVVTLAPGKAITLYALDNGNSATSVDGP